MENFDHTELLYKILVVGDVSTGKTSIIKRYVHNIFSVHYKATIGVDFALKVIKWDDNTTVRLQLWDIAGQERYGNMTRVYYKEAAGAFVVYDVTRPQTLDSIKKWKSDIDAKITFLNTENQIPVILLANKLDLITHDADELANQQREMHQICQDLGFVAWYGTSAKDNVGIDNANNKMVTTILDMIPKNYNSDEDSDDEDQKKKIIDLNKDKKNKETGCCG